jgi:hypothetical protein
MDIKPLLDFTGGLERLQKVFTADDVQPEAIQDIVEDIVAANPGIIDQQDEHGCNALHHYAPNHKATAPVLLMLIQSSQSSCRMTNNEGQTPLNLDCLLKLKRFFSQTTRGTACCVTRTAKSSKSW